MTARSTRRMAKGVCTVEQAAVLDFTPLDLAAMGGQPNRDVWMQNAAKDFVLVAFAIAVLTKNKAELVDMFREQPEASTELVDGFMELEERYKAAQKTIRAAMTRLLVSGSALAVES